MLLGLGVSVVQGLFGMGAERRARRDAARARKVALADEKVRFVRLRESAELGGFNPLTVLESGFSGPSALPSGVLSASDTAMFGDMKAGAVRDGVNAYMGARSAANDARRAAVDEGNLALDRERLSLERERLVAQTLASPYGPSNNYRTGPVLSGPSPGGGLSTAGTWSAAPPSSGLSGAFGIAPAVVGYTTTGLAVGSDGNLVPRDLATGGGSWIDVDETAADADAWETRYSEPGGWIGAGIAAMADADHSEADGFFGSDNIGRAVLGGALAVGRRLAPWPFNRPIPQSPSRAAGEPRNPSYTPPVFPSPSFVPRGQRPYLPVLTFGTPARGGRPSYGP